jgi:hypothetical protein
MSDLDTIVDITISADATPLTRTGFGTLALVTSQEVLATPTVDTYTSLAAVAADFAALTPVHRMASAAFSQDPRPRQIKVIKTGLALAQSVSFVVSAATSGIVTTLTVYRPDGTSAAYSYTQAGADTTTDIATALAALINAGETGTPVTTSTATITFANVTDGDLFHFGLDANLITYLDGTADPGLATRMDAALLVDSDFYGVVLDCNSNACVQAMAAWVESNDRLFIASTGDARELTSGGVMGAALVSAAYERTACLYHSLPRQYAAVAWMAARLIDPDRGQKTWAYTTLTGVTVDTLTGTQRAFLVGDKMNFYVTLAGRNVTLSTSTSLPGGGYTATGEWIDIIHGTDWLKTRIQEDVATTIMNAGRLPYDQGGMDAIGATIMNRMKFAESPSVKFLLADSSVVTVPEIADVSSADRQARTLNNVTATGRYASAIHKVFINVTLSY